MHSNDRNTRRRFLRLGGALTAAVIAPWSRAADARTSLKMGLLRNPVSGLIAVTDQKGWF
jgi:hypothetical protein